MIRWFKELLKLAGDEGNQEVELSFAKLSDEGFSAFISSNDFNVAVILELSDVLTN